MSTSRRAVLGAASASLALSGTATAALPAFSGMTADLSDTVTELVRLSRDSNAILMRGDIRTYATLLSFTDDFTLMSPFGGEPTHGVTAERMEAMGRFFKNGTLEMELVQAYSSPDMVVLATIERARVEVGGLPAQDWALRVTLVYRREEGEWRLAHRHADPLVRGVSLQEAAALAG